MRDQEYLKEFIRTLILPALQVLANKNKSLQEINELQRIRIGELEDQMEELQDADQRDWWTGEEL